MTRATPTAAPDGAPLLIAAARVVDPASGLDMRADVLVSDSKIEALYPVDQGVSARFVGHIMDARGCVLAPGLIDLAVRLREPGHEHERMLETELAAAVAGGVSALVCPPDTEPVLDEPGMVQMLGTRVAAQGRARVYPLAALTRGLEGKALTEMDQLRAAGCIGFSHADRPLVDTQLLWRSLQYASTHGHAVWLRPQDAHLARGGVAAAGALATRMGLAGVPVAAETIALHTLIEAVRSTGCRVHVCRLSSAAGVAMMRAAKAEGLPLSCDVSVHNLHLTDVDIGYFDPLARLEPVLRQQRDRDALAEGLADGTIDALVSDHTPVEPDAKLLPFAQAEPGASAVELLLPLALRWARRQCGNDTAAALRLALEVVTVRAARAAGLPPVHGRIEAGAPADLVLFDPDAEWQVTPERLRSQSKATPFIGSAMLGRVVATWVGGRCVFGPVDAGGQG
jgi:dihydroorotase